MNKHSNNYIFAQIRNWLIVLALFALLVVLGMGLFSSFKNLRVSQNKLTEVQFEYQMMLDRQTSVEGLLSAFDSDFGFEKYVRENFGFSRPGEVVVIILPKVTDSEM